MLTSEKVYKQMHMALARALAAVTCVGDFITPVLDDYDPAIVHIKTPQNALFSILCSMNVISQHICLWDMAKKPEISHSTKKCVA